MQYDFDEAGLIVPSPNGPYTLEQIKDRAIRVELDDFWRFIDSEKHHLVPYDFELTVEYGELLMRVEEILDITEDSFGKSAH